MSPSNIEALEARIKDHEKEIYRHNCALESLHEAIEHEKRLADTYQVRVELAGGGGTALSGKMPLQASFITLPAALCAIGAYGDLHVTYQVLFNGTKVISATRHTIS
jgi:hypothetical protein